MEYDPTLDAQRKTLRNSLNDIASEVNSALVTAGLVYPIYISIPFSGFAYATFACPVDPTDSEWDRITAIVVDVIGKRIEVDRLVSHSLSCAMAGTTMGSAEVIATDASLSPSA
jgi:hypothetical protein